MPLHKHANPQNKRGRKEVEKKIQNLRREEAVDEGEEDEEDLLNLVIPERPESPIRTLDSQAERLVITDIVVENFKSYFGRHVLGPFHQNFTAIIGPNGSGKSNVIDSVLFVFGYRASKIRSKKLSVLIHSSAGREDIQSCTVSVNFQRIIGDDGRNAHTNVEGRSNKFSVSRTAFRDNSSRYAINDRSAQMKDVDLLLRKNGIDLVHNRFLILQGEVEQISLMKPKAENENQDGMLEYLEDIIGSNRLKEPIHKLQNRLEKIDEQRATQLQRFNHAEKEKIKLEEPVSKVLSKMRLENAINTVRNRVLSFKRLKYKDKMDEILEGRSKLDGKVKECRAQLKEIEESAKHFEREKARLQKSLDQCQEALQSLDKEVSDKNQALSKMRTDKKRSETRIKELKSELSDQKNDLEKWKSAPEKAQKMIDLLKIELEQSQRVFEENSEKIQEKLSIVYEQSKEFQRSKKELDEQLGKFGGEEDSLNRKLVIAQEKLINLERDETVERKKLAEFKEKRSEMEERLANKKREQNSASNCLPKAKETLEKQALDLKRLRKREEELVFSTKNLRSQFEEKRQALESVKSTNRLLNALMQEKEAGTIKGIFGRLGDLGAIDEKYDVAISTTCGSLNNIVVADVSAAQECIQFLKHEKLGIATFIILDKQQGHWQRIKNKPKTPENAPRLLDLIRVKDEQVLVAFYFALRDTLVASDIVSATRIAFGTAGQRWRTVTLNGEVVETSGSMTGGGSGQRRGLIGKSVRVDTTVCTDTERERLTELEQELQKANSQLQETRQQISSIDSEHSRQNEEVQRLEKLARQTTLEVNHFTEQLGNLSEQIRLQDSRVRAAVPDPAEVRRIQLEINRYKEDSSKISEKTNSLRTQISEIMEKINEIREKNIGVYTRKRDEAAQKKTDLEKSIGKEKATIASSQRNITKIAARIADLDTDSIELGAKLVSTSSEIETMEQKIETLKISRNEREESLSEANRAFREAITLNNGKDEDEIRLTKEIDDLKRELKQVHSEFLQFQAKSGAVKEELSKLRLYRIEEFADIIDIPNTPENGEETDGEQLNDSTEEMMMDTSLNETALISTSQRRSLLVPDGLDEFLNDDSDNVDETVNVDPNGSSNSQDATAENQESALDQEYFKPLPRYKPEKVREYNIKQLQEQQKSLEHRRDIERINLAVLIDFKEKVGRYKAELEQLESITKMRDRYREQYEKYKKMRVHEFMDGFQQISGAVKEIYQMITLQGDAALELVDSLDPFSEGISFSIRPPKKSWKQIGNLSGGEKTLASLSLVFGLHTYRPSPFYVMDEIDAALDFRNVSIISIYILERAFNTQLIVVSLRNQMFERAHRLMGICKVDDCTRNIIMENNMQKLLQSINKVHLE